MWLCGWPFGGALAVLTSARDGMASRGGRTPMGGPSSAGSPKKQPGSLKRTPTQSLNIEDLDKLDKVMLLVAALGIIVNLTQVVAISNHAWVKATALADGQPFTAFLALDSVTFGTPEAPQRDNSFFCNRRGSCDLYSLCKGDPKGDVYEKTGLLKNTMPAAWCGFEEAGSLTIRLLWFGLLLGLGATGISGMYSAQAFPEVADAFDKIEAMGFTEAVQKGIMCTLWVALWLFVFASMATYALFIPDTLGWDTVELESSFGLLRLCFVLVSINTALVLNSVFEEHGNPLFDKTVFVRLWQEFWSEIPWKSARKYVYIMLMVQLVLYFLMMITELDWAVLLLVLAFIYVTDPKRNHTFMVRGRASAPHARAPCAHRRAHSVRVRANRALTPPHAVCAAGPVSGPAHGVDPLRLDPLRVAARDR